MNYQLFMVQMYENSPNKFVTWVSGREAAKRAARNWFGNYPGEISPDQYIVTPLTNPKDRVKLDLPLSL